MSDRSKVSIRSTKVEGKFDMMIRPTGSKKFSDKVDLTAAEVVDYLLSGPLIDFREFDVHGKEVNHEAIHAEARSRGKPIVNKRPCETCGNITRADPSCPECGFPGPSA